MADFAPVLLWMADTTSECVFFNATWLAFTGRTLEEEIGVGWAEGVHPEDFQHTMNVYTSAYATRVPFRVEYRLRRADGVYRWLLDQGTPRFARNGAFAGYIGSCIDITVFKEMQSELDQRVRQRTAELAAAVADLESFSYSVSHDLRAPLRSIDRFSQALLEDHAGQLDAAGVDYLHRVRAATDRMAALIDDLLDLARITRLELQRQRVDVSALAREIAAELAAEPGHRARIAIADRLAVFGDPRLLAIALRNLLANACKYSSKVAAPVVELGAATLADGERVLFVRDNGVGFDMATAVELFQPFRRLHAEADFPGTGIGLATVHRIVTRHGGRIWASSMPDRGATFYLALPAAGDAD